MNIKILDIHGQYTTILDLDNKVVYEINTQLLKRILQVEELYSSTEVTIICIESNTKLLKDILHTIDKAVLPSIIEDLKKKIRHLVIKKLNDDKDTYCCREFASYPIKSLNGRDIPFCPFCGAKI